ncbi:MAG: response regulator transcription factor [Alphaproteobacteria bacterium]|nr:response regulator transcription factor [Alphaproteobacteria bacterium]
MKILIADDHELFLKGLEIILTDFNPSAELIKAKNYIELLDVVKNESGFDLILTDLAMPGGIWLDALKEIHDKLPETPIIILSAVFEKEIVQKTLDLGAAGYIPKTSSNAVILSAVNLVLSGGVYIPPELLKSSTESSLDDLKKIDELNHNADLSEKIRILSPRQLDVLKLIAEGKSNKQIAYELGLTEGTVKLHVTAILKLLNVYNRTGAVAQATTLGLLKKS